MENRKITPISYNNIEEMGKPISELIEELRTDLAKVRGKVLDIRRIYGYDDRLEHVEGGITCLISAMYNSMMEFKKREIKQKA